MRELRNADGKALDPFGNVMRGGLPLERRVHREHDFVDSAVGNAPNQRIDRKIFRAHPLQRGQPPAEHMITTGKQPRTIERPQIGDLLDDTQRARIAALVGAYLLITMI